MKTILISCLLLTVTASHAELDLLSSGDFSHFAEGEAVGTPWSVALRGGAEVKRSSLPGSDIPWVHIKDGDAQSKATMHLETGPVQSGTFDFKVRYLDVPHGASLGIYLGVDRVSSSNSRFIEFKTSKSGAIYFGSRGDRRKVDLEILNNYTYHFRIKFSKLENEHLTADLQTVEGEIVTTLESFGNIQLSQPISSLAIATDSKHNTDVLLGGIRLVAE